MENGVNEWDKGENALTLWAFMANSSTWEFMCLMSKIGEKSPIL
jgi:hypothetical protein